MRQLKLLPRFEPDPRWKRRTKRRLIAAFDRLVGMSPRRWALYATNEIEPVSFANWVQARGAEWRPVAVSPERLATAVRSIQPALVVIDPRVEGCQFLERSVRRSLATEAFVARRPLFS